MPLRFQHLTMNDGLVDNTINCVLKDRAGYLWIGTEQGLDRYDGQRIDHISGATYAITALAEDKQGALWVTTKDNGLLRVDPTSRAVRHFTHDVADPHSLGSDQLTSAFDLDDTTLLIGSREHTLLFMDKRTAAFSYWADSLSLAPSHGRSSPSGLSGWCHRITALNDTLLRVGLLNNHLSFVVDRRTYGIIHHLYIEREGTETQSCAALLGDRLFSGGWQSGLDVIHWKDRSHEVDQQPRVDVIPTADEVLSLATWPDGRIVAGMRGAGLLLLDPATRTPTRLRHLRSDPTSLPSDRIRCCYTDAEGTLWIGTVNGLAYHVPHIWSMRMAPIFEVQDDDHPELLFHGLEREGAQGVRAFTSNGIYTQAGSDAAFVHSAFIRNDMELQPTFRYPLGDDHSIWGTEYGLVERKADASGPMRDIHLQRNNGGIHTPGQMYQVRYFARDSIGPRPVWVIGTLGYGIDVVDATTHDILGFGMPNEAHRAKARYLVHQVVRDAKGTYWVASGDGLYRWNADQPTTDPQAETRFPYERLLVAGTAVVRIELRHDTVWALTGDDRLLCIVQDAVTSYPVPGSTTRHGLAADAHGDLWITTNDGLQRFHIGDHSFTHIPVNDGSVAHQLTRAITTLNDGHMAFAAGNTIFRFDPATYGTLPRLPTPYITHTSAAGSAIDHPGGQVELSYRASLLDVGLSALAFGYPGPLTFAYRLEGVEHEWRTTTAHEPIRYAGVPTGEHHLLVRVVDPYGRTGPALTLLTIQVNGPFWQAWWFYAVSAILIAGIVYAWSRYRLRQTLRLHGMRDRIASDLHDEVGSSLSSITIGSKLATHLSTGENAKVKEILARIGETSSESLRSMSDIVWAIDPKNDQGEALIKRMRRTASELLESKGIEVHFDVTGGAEELKLPMNTRKELVLIFKEAIHNASKYSDATLVRCSLHRGSGTLALNVQDDGRGFHPALHADGHGLGSMQRRAAALGTTLRLQSAPGTGTTVGVTIDLTRIRD
jgi:signal transduction histidine kinase/streptogramin lyase